MLGRGEGVGADLVIVAEGFTAEDMALFHTAVDDYVNFFFDYEPEFTQHKKSWNIHRIDLQSEQSGADNDSGDNQVNTALDGYFNCGNVDRRLCVDVAKTFAVVNQTFPQWDNILVIVNSSKYGGAGYSNGIGTVSMSSSTKYVAIHEMAHSFAHLGDEYSYGQTSIPSNEPSAANLTINNNTATVKWLHWLGYGSGDGEVGLFEGAAYVTSGVWRPTNNSLMRINGAAFYAVNKEAWTLAVYEHGGVYIGKIPEDSNIEITAGHAQPFMVDTLMDEGAQSLRWYINGQEQSALRDQASVKLGQRQTDDFVVRVEINDKTQTIRKDTFQYSSDSIEWQVSVK